MFKNFDTIFMKNIKKLLKKLIVLSFFHKIFLKLIPKSMPLGHLLTVPFTKYNVLR